MYNCTLYEVLILTKPEMLYVEWSHGWLHFSLYTLQFWSGSIYTRSIVHLHYCGTHLSMSGLAKQIEYALPNHPSKCTWHGIRFFFILFRKLIWWAENSRIYIIVLHSSIFIYCFSLCMCKRKLIHYAMPYTPYYTYTAVYCVAYIYVYKFLDYMVS